MSLDIQRQQPESDRAWSIETNGINPIPETERHGTPRELFWIWCAANIGILGITYGAFLVSSYGLNLWQAIIAAIVGTIVSFVLVGFVSLAGKKGSAPTLILSRASFGVHGNAVPTLLSYVSLVGWEIYLVAIATLGAQAILKRLSIGGGNVTLAIAFVLIAAATIAIGLLGHATIVKIQTWFTWAFAVMTVGFFALVVGDIDWSKAANLPTGSLLKGFVGGTSIIMVGLGIGWVNAAADYSRYLPRSASSRGVVGWTVFGASVAPIILIVFGVLLAANDPNIANAVNPGDLAKGLPTWYLVPYLVTAVGGLIAGALLDIYSSGLNLLTLGLRIARYKSVAIDGALMLLGNIYLLFIAKSDFLFSFLGFLLVLGVAMASWSAVFLVDLWLNRSGGYAERDLYDPNGRYGSVNWAAIAAFAVAVFLGLGLITSFSPVFESWVGYLLGPFGGPTGGVGASSIGILISFLVAGVLYAVLTPLLSPERRSGE
jgi:nucleobase:cation symporter-1, NCS1 family